MDEKVERKGTQDDEDESADEWPHRSRDSTDNGNDQDIDTALDRNRTRRDLPIVPNLKNTSERRHKGCEGIGCDAVRVDVKAKRGHPPRIVAYALQRETKRRAREIEHREITQRRGTKRHVIERNVRAPVHAPEMRGSDGVDAGVAVEDRPVLI